MAAEKRRRRNNGIDDVKIIQVVNKSAKKAQGDAFPRAFSLSGAANIINSSWNLKKIR
ncbi:hypothetical protein QFZ81_001793 [Paenibacillus sp. V4I9]|uniref:hypothetical protein n=1 Tax=Paenibacillus sp. V4I9 TaxID=3042308 RepID=UPI00278084E5|nr:hypothetical protein [Paenibacillus sp. V4I9]MDQ0886705.1 hypothetical protein [Paenibacillus sp. V4I9]